MVNKINMLLRILIIMDNDVRVISGEGIIRYL